MRNKEKSSTMKSIKWQKLLHIFLFSYLLITTQWSQSKDTVAGWIKKQDPTTCCLHRIHLLAKTNTDLE
jgi:hypothetical protein